MRLRAASLAIACAVAPAHAGDPPVANPLSADALRATVEFLASDAMAGRDTPSAELDEAASWIAKRFAEAGLSPGCNGSYFHEYELPAIVLDSGAIAASVVADGRTIELKPDADVRLYRGSLAFECASAPAERMDLEGYAAYSRDRRARTDEGPPKPVFVEVAEDNPLWTHCRGSRPVLVRGRGNAPVLLLRAGAVPAGALTATVKVPEAKQPKVKVKNVVGVLEGGERKDEYVMLSAHYDHLGIGAAGGGDLVFNGADDDASGTAAVVQLAAAFSRIDRRPDRSLAFVCFSGEEKGLLGSKAFAADPCFPLDKVVVDLNLEMIGRPPDAGRFKAWITGRDLSDLETLIAPPMKASGVELIDFELQSQLFRQSDNYSLAAKGVVAQSISAGSLHPDYHKPSDSADKLDFEHMEKVTRGLLGATLLLADRDVRPQYNEAGRKRLK